MMRALRWRAGRLAEFLRDCVVYRSAHVAATIIECWHTHRHDKPEAVEFLLSRDQYMSLSFERRTRQVLGLLTSCRDRWQLAESALVLPMQVCDFMVLLQKLSLSHSTIDRGVYLRSPAAWTRRVYDEGSSSATSSGFNALSATMLHYRSRSWTRSRCFVCALARLIARRSPVPAACGSSSATAISVACSQQWSDRILRYTLRALICLC